VPALSIFQPLKVMTPLVSDWPQPERVPPAGLVPIVRVTLLESFATARPPASCTVMTGWVVNALPPAAPAGCVVNAICVAGPKTTTPLAGLAVEVSDAELTVKVVFAYVPAAGFVTPLIPIEVCVPPAREHEPAPAVSARVTVTVGPALVVPVALQFVKPGPRVIVGVAVTANAELKTAVIVEPPTSPPLALDRKPAVQDVAAPAA